MGVFWDLWQEHELDDQREHAESLEDRIADLDPLNFFSEELVDNLIDNVSTDKDRDYMADLSGGKRTVPQIFIDNLNVGGYDDIYTLHKDGKLKNLLI